MSPTEDTAESLFALDIDWLLVDLFLFSFLNDTCADTLDKSASLLGIAMRASGANTKREAAERGLELMVRLAEQAKLIGSARGNSVGKAI